MWQLCGQASTEEIYWPNRDGCCHADWFHSLEQCLLFCLEKKTKIDIFASWLHISCPLSLKDIKRGYVSYRCHVIEVTSQTSGPPLPPQTPHHKWSDWDSDLYMALIASITSHYLENCRNLKPLELPPAGRDPGFSCKRTWSENSPPGVFNCWWRWRKTRALKWAVFMNKFNSAGSVASLAMKLGDPF